MADDSEWEKLPALEKCLHKSWKARCAGYEEVMKELQLLKSNPKDPKFDQYLGNIKKFIVDSNANSQEKGCAAALMFITYADCAKKVVKEAVSGIVVKGLNGKPKTKDLCAQIFLMCVEIEKVTDAREEILEAFSNKQPKIVAAAVNIITKSLNQFGSKVFPIKPLVQKSLLKPIMEHKDGKVRDEGKALVTEMYRWLGDTLSKLLPTLELKEVMLKELEDEWSKVDKGTPERYTRSQQAKMEEEEDEEEEETDGGDGGGGGGGGGGEEAEPEEDMDPYDLADPVDILEKLNKACGDFQNMLVDKSWKIRKEALDHLVPLATGTIKIQPSSDFGAIVTPLCKIISKDANIVVVQLAVKSLGGIAKGLRKGYSSNAKETVIACLSKYKEKKANVVAVLSDCIDASVDTVPLSAVVEHVVASLADKNPAVRQETANFCVRLFQRSKANNLPKSVMKALCPALKALLDDTVGSVRDAGAGVLGTATKVVGEKFMSEYINDLDNIKKQKVTDVMEKAEVKYPYGSAGPAKKAAPAAKAPAKEKAASKSEAPKKEPAKKSAAKKPAKKGAGKKAAPAAKKENKQKQKDSEEITEAEMTEEQVDEAVESLLDAEIIAGLTDANWKVRLEAVQNFSAKVEGFEKNVNVQALIQILGRKPGWKDNNAQVLNEKFGICEKLTHKGDAFTKRGANYALEGLVEKIGDIKMNRQVTATLLAIADVISLNFTSANACGYAEKAKSPKVHTEMCKWLENAITLFGMKINIKSHLSFVKMCVSSPNAQIRGAALNLIGTMSMYSGAAILSAFSDTDNKNTLSQIEAAIEKYKNAKPPAPTRGITADDNEGGADGEGEAEADEGGAEEALDLEDLIERKDISADLDKACSLLDSTVWKERVEGLEAAERAMNGAMNIQPNLGSDFQASMKGRLSDKNMAVKTKAIGVMSTLGKVLGTGTKKHKELMVSLIPLLADSKKMIQTQVLDVMNIWIEHLTIRPLLTGEDLVAASTDNNPNLRICLFTWLTEQIKTAKVPPRLPKELNLLVLGVYKSLEDRNPDVRKVAQALLPYMMAHVGYSQMVEKVGSVDAKNKKTVQDFLEKYKDEADALAPKKPPPKAKAQPKDDAPKKKSQAESLKSSTVEDADSEPEATGTKRPAKKGVGKKPGGGAPPPSSKKKKGEEEDTDSPLKANDKKKQRFKDEAGLKLLKWNFKVPRQEYFDQLQELMEPMCSPGLFAKLFHPDFKQHNEALNILITIIPTHMPEIKQSLDLLLKWISLRFFDTNTSVLLAALDWLSKCFEALREDDYILLEQEGSAFMPYLIIKLGDSKEPVRKSVQALFNELCYIYPASRTFYHLSEGLKVKNSRQRSGVLDQLTKLILENGIEVCQPTPKKAFEAVASFIGDKDNSVRMAALNCCVAGWNYIGESIKKMCGTLNDKDLGMLEERIKRGGKRIASPPKAKTSQKSKSQAAIEPVSEPQKPKAEAAVELDDIPVEIPDEPVRSPSPPPPPPPKKRGEFYIDYSNLKPVQMRTHTRQTEIAVDDLTDFTPPEFNFFKYSPVVMDIEGINIRDVEEINYDLVEKVGNLRHPMISVVIETVSDLNNMLKDPQNTALFKNYVNNLIMSAISQLTHFPGGEDERELTVYRAITSIIMQVINNETLAKEISTDYIKKICRLFLAVLSEEQKSSPTIETLIKGVNALVIRLLTNCSTGRAISALVAHMDSLLSESGRSRSPKELEILLKCLWKLMSRLEKEFDLTAAERNEILVLLARFLRRLPSSVWKDGHDNDKPYRTIKTLVHKFCKGLELKVLEDVECLSMEDVNILRPLVDSFLTALGYDLTNLITAGTKSPTGDHKLALDEMFECLKDKDQVKSTLLQLHTFILENPSLDVSPHLASLSDVKKRLVEKILIDLRKSHSKARCHRTKLAISNEREQMKCNLNLSEKKLTELKNCSLRNVLKDTRNTLTKHKESFPNDSREIENLINKIPKEKEAQRSRLPTSTLNSIPRPTSSPSRSPARSGSQIPSRSMDDLKKRLEMIKKRSKPT
ncbi:cytoskeleton-associated protein 5-like isoform X4 [Bolinopsis microptera]|uniref:cytoskeleton-associated protein 5-like isoform X4 n=1 Tax=Bolinopsis microptera TaxID=2820187 RepID=UPI0030799D94